ncbi:site-2 protease family protein [Clostridium sp. WLY-B-L2]|jgi:Zn-dependent protease|uniref:Site-2 protease family protein n=1 Tax=Clostridium aromativorans TaxID=2836848 RepID=A0ABS8N4U6_9CLOT|nr:MULTISPECIES: site-2 protease family protein [Clostridium]MCC9294822.1 site-2 protease family protein [Clostridium aromativorans]CAB1250720.1 Site-2 protease family protein [Clostridiaceae bacterium BL-3]
MKYLTETILEKVLIIPAILIGFAFHEFAHAITADRLGDKTPKFQGRLTLNPFAHVDIIGFIMILLVGFGWAKPVEINPSAFKNRNKDDLKVSIAGPLANLIIAFLAAMLVVLLYKWGGLATETSSIFNLVVKIILYIVNINCMLFVFNLIPIPGLDGFHILRDIFPSLFYRISGSIYRYQIIILLLFVATPLAKYVVGIPSFMIYKTFIRVANNIF